MTTDLDGLYHVSSTSNYDGPLVKRSDGVTEIRNGQTSRRDGNNVLWTSSFRIVSEQEVEMVSVADPTEARGDFALLKHDGTPSRAVTTYTARLRLARKEDKIQLSGQIQYGDEIVLLTLRKTAP